MTDSFFGSKGGGSGSFSQRPDTLRSNDAFEGILGIAVGPLKGLTKGLKSQKLNGTFVEDASGVLNFKNMIIEVKNGDPALFPQPIIPALGSGGVPTAVNISLTNTDVSGSVPGDWVTRTMGNLNADFIDLRFIAEQLYTQDKSGIREATANLEIQMKPTGLTTWISPLLNTPTGTYNSNDGSLNEAENGTKIYLPKIKFNNDGTYLAEGNNGYFAISGKTTSPYVKELRIRVPNQGSYVNKTWDIRVRLREPANIDADPNFTKRVLRWESLSGGYSTPMGTTEGWRGVASIRLYGKATDEFNGVPTLEGIWDTKIVSVPPIGVYNPDTRQYTGAVWDGSFSKAFTTDPAWIINDVLADGLFGMSSLAPGSYLNKWDALEVSKWCSQLVWDGGSGTHPRYNLNFRSQAPQKANEFVQYLAGAIGGFAWDNGNGEWRIKLDKAEAPSDIITLETIDGEFGYSHTDISTRYNDITGTFLNEDLDYREDRVSVVDDAAIALYGRKPTTVVLVGCTNRQEAVRRITLRLRASLNETKMVNFATNRRGRLLIPFSTVLIADGDLGYQLPTGSGSSTDLTPYNNRTTGRVVTMDQTRTNITLRDSVRLELGVSYVLHFTIPNPNYNPTATSQPTDSTYDKPTLTTTRTISNSAGQRGDVNTLYLSAALPTGLPESLAVAIEAAGLPSIPKMYRVLGVNVDDQNPERHTISCIEVDTGKQAAADSASSSSASYQAPTTIVPKPLAPSTGTVLTIKRIAGNGPDIINLQVNWQRPASLFLAGFRVQYRLNNGPLIEAVDGLQDTSFELVNPPEGLYSVEICARDRRGNYSAPLTATYNVTTNLGALAAKGSADWTVDVTNRPLVTGQAVSADEFTADITRWSQAVTTGWTRITTPTRRYSDTAFRTSSGNTGTQIIGQQVPFDRNGTYAIEGWLDHVGSNSNQMYLGILMQDAAGAAINNFAGFTYADGRYSLPTSGIPDQFFMLFGAGTDNPFPANAVSMAPMAYVQSGATTGYTIIDGLRITKLSRLPEWRTGVNIAPTSPTKYALTSGSIIKTDHVGSWDSAAYTRAFYKNIRVSGIPITGKDQIIGLTNSVNYLYNVARASVYYRGSSDNKLLLIEQGTQILDCGIYATPPVIEIDYDGGSVRYYANGTLLRSLALGTDFNFWGAIYGYHPGSGFNSLTVGPSATTDFALSTGLTRPENNATLGDNRIRNPSMGITSTDTWWGTLTRTAGVAANSDPTFFARTTTAAGGGGSFNNGANIPCVGGETLFCSALVRSASGTTNNIARFNPFFYDAAGAFISQQTLDMVANATTWAVRKLSFTAPSNAATFVLNQAIYCNSGGNTDMASPRVGTTEYLATVGAIAGTNLVDSSNQVLTDSSIKNVAISIDSNGSIQGIGTGNALVLENTKIAVTGNNLTGIGTGNNTPVANSAITLSAAGVLSGGGTSAAVNALSILNGPVDAGADVTLLVTGTKSVTVAYDSAGVAKSGSLPVDVNFKLINSANTDVTTSASWAGVLKSGSATFTPTVGTPNTSGVLNITVLSTDAVIEMRGTYSGKTRTGTATLIRVLDPPPAATSYTTNTNTISSSTTASYGAANTSVLTVKAGSGGQVVCTFPDSFKRGSNGTGDSHGKWQWRVPGGTFADITTEIASTASAYKAGLPDPVNDPGNLEVTMTKTGLTNGVDYEFQLLLRSDGAYTINHIGTAAVAGS